LAASAIPKANTATAKVTFLKYMIPLLHDPMKCGGCDGGESSSLACGGCDGGESSSLACGGCDGGESASLACGGFDGGESVIANTEPARAQPAITANRLVFIVFLQMCSKRGGSGIGRCPT